MYSTPGLKKLASQTDQRSPSSNQPTYPNASEKWRSNGPVSFAVTPPRTVSKWTKPASQRATEQDPPRVPSSPLASSILSRPGLESPADPWDKLEPSKPGSSTPSKWKASVAEATSRAQPPKKLSHYEDRLSKIRPRNPIPPRQATTTLRQDREVATPSYEARDATFVHSRREAPHLREPRVDRRFERETPQYANGMKDDQLQRSHERHNEEFEEPPDPLDVLDEPLSFPDLDADLGAHGKRFERRTKGVGNVLNVLKAEREQYGLRKRKVEEQTRLQKTTIRVQRKPKILEARSSKDVYIPNNISVANLARLLGVRHSTFLRLYSIHFF
jgi:hypothetical protein